MLLLPLPFSDSFFVSFSFLVIGIRSSFFVWFLFDLRFRAFFPSLCLFGSWFNFCRLMSIPIVFGGLDCWWILERNIFWDLGMINLAVALIMCVEHVSRRMSRCRFQFLDRTLHADMFAALGISSGHELNSLNSTWSLPGIYWYTNPTVVATE